MIDVHIIGGGPAGCFAGIAACQNGKNALLSEEHARIGEPEACSGLVSKRGLESLMPHVDYHEAMLNTITSAKIICGNEELVINPRDEVAILVSRGRLDRLAADRFESEGGKLELGKKVTREFACKSVIGADGPASAVADFFGFPKIGTFAACRQGVFNYRCENSRQTIIYLSSEHFPGFFGWMIPINEEKAEIGLGVLSPKHPAKYYDNFISRLGITQKGGSEFSAVIPLCVRGKTAMRKSGHAVLLAGDAAGQVKATTGGGVFFGSQCGMLAGKHAGNPEAYEKEWRERFGLDLTLHNAFRSMLNVSGGAPHPPILSLGKALFFDELLAERGRMDQWGKMLDPSLLGAYAKVVARKIANGKGMPAGD